MPDAGQGTKAWSAVVADAVVLRRELHRHPEPTWQEVDTAARIRRRLDDLGVAWRACAETGTVATLAPTAPGRHVALRADMDAMPLDEDSGVAWTSRRPGVMHACGHDGHVATLLATASWLVGQPDLPGPVTLLFQPAEEGGHGARRMIDDGCLAGSEDSGPVDVVFGWHNWPGLAFGRAACPDGPVMSANGTFEIEVVGRGGHASQPEATRDPVLAAGAVTVALQQVVARRLAPQAAAVVAVTWLDAPSAATVTPDRARLGGSVRVADTDARDRVFGIIDDVATATARAHGVRATTTTSTRYGATVNHPAPAATLRAALATEFGDDWADHDLPVPVMASEDFSYYLQEVPGAFALVGAGNAADDDHGGDAGGSVDAAGGDGGARVGDVPSAAGAATTAPLHSVAYDFNDALVAPVARVYLDLAGLAGAPHPDT